MHGKTQPPAGAYSGSSPGLEINWTWSGWRGQMIGNAGLIWSLLSISSRIVDHVGFFRRFEAFPRTNSPCFALDNATLIRFGL